MKKVLSVLLLSVLSVLVLSSCAANYLGLVPAATADSAVRQEFGSGGGAWRASQNVLWGEVADFAPAMPVPAPASAPMDMMAEMDVAIDSPSVAGEAYGGGSGLVPITPPVSESSLAERIIYTVSADIETLHYEQTLEQVNRLMALNGAFIESHFVGGVNLENTMMGWNSMRTARFTLRVPTHRLNAVTADLSLLGNVASLSSDAQNITQQFSDTEARLTTLRTQETRLLELLINAENIEEMLAIEDRLSWVRFDIESMTSTLRNWQNQIDYSTLHLFVREVEEFTVAQPRDERGYWQQMGDGIVDTLRGIGRFFMDIFMWFATNIPILIILAVVVIVIIVIIRRQLRKVRVPRQNSD
ncbi:MAG: DUF4349 domain-containing protein, partial [Oscillospiraceae bacterium]|nr:DUF4349 domain-containing protein [Oscillospiraceae bacterium]